DYLEYAVLLPAEWNDSILVVIDLIPDRDGIDTLFQFEELEFNGTVYTLESLLGIVGNTPFPTEYVLFPSYPNPFNPVTHIRFHLPIENHISLEIIDVMGRTIKSIKNNILPAGIYNLDWDGRTANGDMAPAGIYFIRMISGHYQKTHKILLLK
ncbi:MAG TPA: T9SS type A sorting domain-containing protein, partial [Candidatus Marinimicrobia bacterium]|nr:T9SS type A sorting domain-containing protein [Candidatus Neomarinimicrobiota bacterium]